MFNKICLSIYEYRCLLGIYVFSILFLGICLIGIRELIYLFKSPIIIPFLEVIAYQVK